LILAKAFQIELFCFSFNQPFAATFQNVIYQNNITTNTITRAKAPKILLETPYATEHQEPQ
jgi:hypothetical protein